MTTMLPPHIIQVNLDLMRQHPGVMIECGVWKGGMMAEMMKMAEMVIGYDSFEGLPEPKDIDGQAALDYAKNKQSAEYYDNCRSNYEEVKNYLSSMGSNYRLIKGWFSNNLFKDCPEISVLRIDCDWHDSVKQCLTLYNKLILGGLVIIDDYQAYDGCAIAVNEFVSGTAIRVREYMGVTYFVKP